LNFCLEFGFNRSLKQKSRAGAPRNTATVRLLLPLGTIVPLFVPESET
jgi:hypothetical protein